MSPVVTRLRHANLLDGSERTHGPDHLSGPSSDELVALLSAEGFDVVERTGLHLELFLNWLSPLPQRDRLRRRWNRPWAIPLLRLMLAAGAVASRYPVDLVFVARRVQASSRWRCRW